MFDSLYCLARGGVCIYSGPPNGIADHLRSAAVVNDGTEAAAISFPIEQLISYSCEGPQCELVQRLMRAASGDTEQRSAIAAELTANTQLAPEGVLQNRTRFSLSSVAVLSHRYLVHIVGYQWRELLAFALILFYYGNNLHVFWPSSIATVSGCLNLEDDLSGNHSARCGGRRSESESEQGREEKAVEDSVKYTVFMCILFLLFIVLQASLTLYREMSGSFLCEKRNGKHAEMVVVFFLLALAEGVTKQKSEQKRSNAKMCSSPLRQAGTVPRPSTWPSASSSFSSSFRCCCCTCTSATSTAPCTGRPSTGTCF